MKQIGNEKDDPLKRIQEEINEVARRERELREKMQLQQQQQQQQPAPVENGLTSPTGAATKITTDEMATNDSGATIEEAGSCVVVVNDKEHSDEHHSDDSGISASSSPINGTSSNTKKYIRPNGYSTIPNPPPQKILSRAMSTPQIFVQNRRFSINPSQKGLMQRFIASRGKLPGHTNNNSTNNGGSVVTNKDAITNDNDHVPRPAVFIPPVTVTPPIIERDADGRPIRRGYVPVEEKIQKELRDLKSRETELKRLRRITSRQSQPDLLDSIEDGEFESDDDSEVEHCYAPGKLRSSKSISELCDAMNNTQTSTPRTTPSPNFDRKASNSHNGGLRPAVSLAQLCDLNPEEAPSSHQLIAKWESLIQRNA